MFIETLICPLRTFIGGIRKTSFYEIAKNFRTGWYVGALQANASSMFYATFRAVKFEILFTIMVGRRPSLSPKREKFCIFCQLLDVKSRKWNRRVRFTNSFR